MKLFAKLILAMAGLVTALNFAQIPAQAINIGEKPFVGLLEKADALANVFEGIVRPDLVVHSGHSALGPQPTRGFCGLRDGETVLVLRIVNLGEATAAASKVKINWGAYGSVHQLVGQLQPNQAWDITVPFPPDTSKGGLVAFAITADVHAQVYETQESNNTARGACFRPPPR